MVGLDEQLVNTGDDDDQQKPSNPHVSTLEGQMSAQPAPQAISHGKRDRRGVIDLAQPGKYGGCRQRKGGDHDRLQCVSGDQVQVLAGRQEEQDDDAHAGAEESP